MNLAFQIMNEECWIRPKTSTALDTMFQPLYIGGAMANDKKLSLGDLCYGTPNKNGETNLQYVHDFGDWWSHTITITHYHAEKEDIQALPQTFSVAHILSGQGGCPPEDTGGVIKYCRIMAQLTGKLSVSNDSNDPNSRANLNFVQPSSQEWWDLLNTEVRAKLNWTVLSNPLDFDLEAARDAVETAIHLPKQSSGNERDKMINRDVQTGLASETNHTTIPQPNPQDRADFKTKVCAVCGVTVALKLCNGCKSVAFCGREHQVKHWPVHKAVCKRIQKERTK